MIYIKANGAIGVGNLVKAASADDPFTNAVIATASAAGTFVLGMSPHTLAAGDYAWIVKRGVFEDEAQLGVVAAGEPFTSDANGDCLAATAADINNAIGVVLVDDGATGTVLLY